MKSTMATLIAALLVVTPALARNPPATVKGSPAPPIWDRRGGEIADLQPAVHNGVSFVPEMRPWLSGAMFPSLLHANGLHGSSTAQRSGSLTIAPDNVPSSISTQYTVDASASSDAELEPAIISITRSGTDSTVFAWQQLDGTGFFSLHTASSSNLRDSNATFSRNGVTIPGGYTDAYDPTLVANPYTDGARPGAIYLTSCLGFRNSSFIEIANPMQIRMWASDDGGVTWTAGQAVTFTEATSSYIVDKPVTDVSWFSGTRGYVYAVWAEFPQNNDSRIMLRRNTNGLWQRCRPFGGACDTAWDAIVTVNDGRFHDAASVPQVVVNPDNGHVYVFWMNGTTGDIQMRRSTDAGVTFQPAVGAPAITIVAGVNVVRGTDNGGDLPNGMRAQVVPTIRWNSAAHNIMMAWHTRTAPDPTDATALYYLAFNPDTINSPLTIPAPFNDAANSQIQPALDNDDSGNVLVTYLTTQNNNATYQLYGIVLSSAGQIVLGPAALDGNSYPTGFAGDYHDIFYWTFNDALASRWNTSWSRYQTTWDVMGTGVK